MRQSSKLKILVMRYGAAFVSAFNENIVNVALYDIMAQFAVSYSMAQWMVTGYMIVTAIIVAAMAFLTQRFTTRQLFFGATGCLVAGEVLCLFAPVYQLLLAARLLQAVGSGIFIPLMMSGAIALSPKSRMGSYLAIGSAAITLGPALAPVVSGAAVTFLGWRSVFALPAAVMVVLGALGLKWLSNIGEARDARLDVPSLALAAVGLILFVYGLGELTADLKIALTALAISVLCIGSFARRQNHLREPLLNVRPLCNPRFSIAGLLVIMAMMTSFSMSVLLPLYSEGSYGFSALVAGALILPAIVVNAATGIAGGRIMDSRGAWPLLPVGFGLIAMGQAAIAAASGSLGLGTVIAGSVAVYAGVGLVMSPSQTAGLRVLSREEHPHGVSIINMLIMVAASIGPSLFIGILSSGATSAEAAGMTRELAQAAGFSHAIMLAAAIAVAGLAVALVYAWHERD